MQKSKLIELLGTLNSKEWLRLRDYVASPYFNKRPEVSLLLDYFHTHKEEIQDFEFNKEQIFYSIYPDTPFDEKQLAYLFNYLLRFTEEFLGLENIIQDDFLLERSILEELVNRELDKHFNFNYKKFKKQLGTDKKRGEKYWRNRFYLAEIDNQSFLKKWQRRYDDSFQEVLNSLDDYYLFYKLKYGCAISNMDAIVSSKSTIGAIDEVIAKLNEKELIDFHFLIYQKIYECFTQENSDQHFYTLKTLIVDNQDQIGTKDLREILLFSINICAQKIRKGQIKFYEEALELYLFGIENKSLFVDGHLSHWTFNNVVKTAIRLKKYDWLEDFINNNSVHLSEKVREDTMNFSHAELAFSRKNYDAVLTRVGQIRFSDPQYYLGSRIMLLKSFYAIGALDSMSSQLAAFIMFLRRNKKISSEYKKTLLNFCSLLHLILRSKPGKKQKVIDKIKETKQKIEGPWLLEVADGML